MSGAATQGGKHETYFKPRTAEAERERIVDTVPQSVRRAGAHQSRIARAPERSRFAGKHQQGTRFRHERAPAVRGRAAVLAAPILFGPPRAVPFQGDGGAGALSGNPDGKSASRLICSPVTGWWNDSGRASRQPPTHPAPPLVFIPSCPHLKTSFLREDLLECPGLRIFQDYKS